VKPRSEGLFFPAGKTSYTVEELKLGLDRAVAEATRDWTLTDTQASNWATAILAKIKAGKFRRLG
jgi:hypothetical protein